MPSLSNLIVNGDFETGNREPWTCSVAKCEILEDETKYLAITERTAEWSGIKQFLPVEGFASNDDLKVAFNFSAKSPEAITANWKIKVTKSEETKYFVIYTGHIDNQEWETIFEYITLPTFILGSDEVQFYLEVTPGNADIDLDNISLGPEDEGNWEEEANYRIDRLRKRNVKINLNIDAVDSEDLQIEIEQKNHKFPFGTAVKSNRIADCYNSNTDDLYCEFVRDNFNWLVDSYRYGYNFIS